MDIPWKFMLCTSLLLLLQMQHHVAQAQQTYLNNDQLDCYNGINYTRGFVCNGVNSSCSAYLTFRSNPPYTSPVTIGTLLGVQPQLISNLNNLTNFAAIPIDTQIIIPINCSCYGSYYQHNSTYRLMTEDEDYYTVANITYQGLTTCRAMMDANPDHEGHHLRAGFDLKVPLWCACVTPNQAANGAKYLVTYMVTWGQTISSIAQMFGVDAQTIFDANMLSSDLIFPFTPLLVPLKTEATKIQQPLNSPPPAMSPPGPIGPVEKSHSSNKWVFVGAGIGAALLVLVTLLGALFYCFHKRSQDKGKEVTQEASLKEEVSVQFSIESLTLYKFEDLQRATEFFSEANRIKGSVYRGSFKPDIAAIKMMAGEISREINILKQISHTNIIRLCGFCVHDNTYLVYEYAENGSLSDRLHYKGSTALSWKQRVQIAYDIADGLNYLHNYTNPPYVHKNLKTSNILLDGNFRAKISNFGLARAVGDEEEGGFQLTRHVVGTQGYMPPEYIEHGAITSKLDVFAFGVVILKLLSGKEARGGGDKSGKELLSQLITEVLIGDNKMERLRTFVDPSLGTEYPLDLAFSMAELAKNCVDHDLSSRLDMSEAFLVLSKILSSSIEWDISGEFDEFNIIPSS